MSQKVNTLRSSRAPFLETLFTRGPGPNFLSGILVLSGLISGVIAAYFIVRGEWQIALSLIFVLPGLIILHRYPYLALIVWLILGPFLLHTNTAVERKVYWIIHRGLPPLTVSILLLSSALRIHERKLPKPGVPELFMAGYVVLSLISIYLQNSASLPTAYIFYDQVFIPMCLYLIIRFSAPNQNQLRWLIPVALFLAFSQSMIGTLSWFVPQILPSDWLDKAGSRTTGSLVNTSVYSTTLIFAGLLTLHAAINSNPGLTRKLFLFVFLLTSYTIFITFSRSAWIAGILVLLGLVYIYPRFIFKLSLMVVPVALFLGGLLLSDQIGWARQRLYSREAERSAVSRLAVNYAAYQMFQAKPIFGWGYGNFDLYDRRYQWRVAGFPANSKDLSSHNLYLTIIAEQGLTGLLLYVGSMFWLFLLTLKRLPDLPNSGLFSRKLLIILWMAVLSHIVVNNFSNMQVVYGLGMWWTVLGLIAHLIDTPRLFGVVPRKVNSVSAAWKLSSYKTF